MASSSDNASMALFCDFENVALGVRDAQYDKFDIRPVLERLLAKGSIVVKKAYCDWDRYKAFKAAMHEANFELIEIPHVRQSGKNSADIRMVVDALDLCYTKAHVDTFVIISGDSDFSPLVSKLRENAKKVIGVGVKQSCSDLLVTNCDEFIYYDDLVRDRETRSNSRRDRDTSKRSPEEEAKRSQKQEERKTKAVDIVAATFVDLMADRGESERIWASVLKEVVKRRNPGFNESYYGFRTFGNLLEEAASRGLLGFGRDDKGAFVFRGQMRPALGEADGGFELPVLPSDTTMETSAGQGVEVESGARLEIRTAEPEASANPRRRGSRRSRSGKERPITEAVDQAPAAPEVLPVVLVTESQSTPAQVDTASGERAESKPRRGARRPRKAEVGKESTPAVVEVPVRETASSDGEKPAAEVKPVKAKRPSRPRKAKVAAEASED
jgi:uncharacterized protein (TIGR00288 family)